MSIEILQYAALFVVSLGVLLKASDWFIDSAEEIGLSFGISPFIIGVTIIAFGTSLPELATSVASVLSGKSEIVLGNVVGSNITNIALVLGLVAITAKSIKLEVNIWDTDVSFLWGSAALLCFTLRDGNFSLFEAILFLMGIVLFLTYSFNKDDDDDEEEDLKSVTPKTYAMLVIGGVLVWLGANYTIVAIEQLSAIAGINADVIALSAVALGTSLPEVIVSLNAAKKGKTSIAVGNVLGSNIFNTFVVTGVARLFGPLAVNPDMLTCYLPLMLVMTVLFGVMASNQDIDRWEGCLLILFYIYFLGEMFAPYF